MKARNLLLPFVLLGTTVLLSPRWATTTLAFSGCGGITAPVVNADFEQQLIDLVNAERANQTLPPLKRVTELDQAARYHATDLGQDDYFDHDSYDRSGGNLVYSCGWSTRISSFYVGWSSLAENIAAGQATPQDAMNSWMSSAGHRANILSSNVWEIGVGYSEGSGALYRYWVQDFGRRSGIYPLIINREAATSNSQNVSIYIYGSWTQMRLKNDAGTWGSWQPFQSSFNWMLDSGEGTHTVTAQVTNGSTTVSTGDTIYLNGPILGNVPDLIAFIYSNPDQKLFPASFTITPQDVGSGATLNWSLSAEGTWFNISPTTGTTPNSFTITPSSFTKGIETIYTGTVTVTVTSPTGVSNSPKRVSLTLEVTNQSFKNLFLPYVKK